MSVDYFLVFGQGDPSQNSGLAPTFTVFQNPSGGSTTPPSISELNSTGIYTFNYAPKGPIAFVVDGATTGLASSDRYIRGALDLGDENNNLNFGSISDSIGDDSTDPTTLFGFILRIREWLEGDSTYNKANGQWAVKERSGVTTLQTKTIVDNGSTVTKS